MRNNDQDHRECWRYESRVQDCLDQRKNPAMEPELSFHAEKCPTCREVLARYCNLLEILESTFHNHDGFELVRGEQDSRAIHSSPAIVSPITGPIPSRSMRFHVNGLRFAIAASILGLILGGSAIYVTELRNSFNSPSLAVRISEQNAIPPGSVALSDPPRSSGGGRFQTVSNYRSIETCYELTAELPGVRPIQSSLAIAFDWWQKSFGNRQDQPPRDRPDTPNPNLGSFHNFEIASMA